MTTGRTAGCGLLLCILVAVFAPLAHADVAPRRVVTVAITGAPEESRALEASIRELLARLQLTMAEPESAPSGALLEAVAIDLTGTYGAHVVVRSASGTTVLDRTVPRGESASIQREQIAHAVRGAAEAELLVDGDRVAGRAPPVVEPPPDLPPPPPLPPIVVETPPPVVVPVDMPVAPAPERKTLALDVSTFAGGGLFASETSVVARVGGSAAFTMRRDGLRPGLALMALYAFPFEAGDALVEARARLFSLRMLPTLGIVHNARFALEVGAGVGLDVLTVDPSSRRLPVSLLGTETSRVAPIFTGTITGRLALASDVALTLTALLDADPSSRTYVFDDAGARREILAPWAVRPMLLAGLSFTAFGPSR